jgi:hypothetical protein
VWSGDAAFVQLPENATPEQSAAHDKKWEVARETGDYSSLAVEGAGPPTVFTFSQLTHDQTATLLDMSRSRSHGVTVINSLAFHAALQSVSNLGDVEIKRDEFHPRLGLIVSSGFFAKADVPPAVSVPIVLELGEIVFEKMASLSKRSSKV